MKTILKTQHLILVPETEAETATLGQWKANRAGHLFGVHSVEGTGFAVIDLGVREEVAREPINVTSQVKDPLIQQISNFAEAPFELDGRTYQSVESFWQGLKFKNGLERRQVAEMNGPAACHFGKKVDYEETFKYEGETVRVGTYEHWQLMARACHAKFTQHAPSQEALLSTGTRPLTHKVRRDSKTIPGVIMADIWMKIRTNLQKGNGKLAPVAMEAEEDLPEG